MKTLFSKDVLNECIEGHNSPGKTSESSGRRLNNILWIKALDREELSFGIKERQLFMLKTSFGERLFIQYPGKESLKRQRPWDFRPKLIRKDGSTGNDLSFFDIWEILFDRINPHKDKKPGLVKMMAVLFYRMAFMCDHHLEEKEFTYSAFDIGFPVSLPSVRLRQYQLQLPGRLVYRPDPRALSTISNVVTDWGGMSLEAFLHYNELLAWNEDCKYYYRDVEEKGKDWMGSTGRVNNLLTHISILGFSLGVISLSRLLSRFTQMRGVAPASFREIATVTDGYCERGSL